MSGDIHSSGNLYIDNGKALICKIDSSTTKKLLEFDGSQVTLGYGFRSSNETRIYGKNIGMYYGDTLKVQVTSDGLKIGDITIKNENGGLHVIGGGLYADTYISSLGTGSGGSGGGSGNESAILYSLNNSQTPVGNGALCCSNGMWSFQDISTSGWTSDDFTLKDYTTVQDLGWEGTTQDAKKVITSNALAYWDGRFDNSSRVINGEYVDDSNIKYCYYGAFGTIVTKNAGDYLALTNGNVSTSGSIYTSSTLEVVGVSYLRSSVYFGYAEDYGYFHKIYTRYRRDPSNLPFMALQGLGGVYVKDLLYVDGDESTSQKQLQANDKLYVNGNGVFEGDVSAWDGFNDLSDMRLKDVHSYIDDSSFTLEDVARAPMFRFTWKDRANDRLHVGTSAQYWDSKLPEVVTRDGDGYLGMTYANAAMIAAITTARKVLTHDEQIAALTGRLDAVEAENKRLKDEIEQLKAA